MGDEWVVIEHADGRRYSVTRDSHATLYPDFAIVGEETGAAFVADVPQPIRRAGARRKTTKPAKAGRVAEPGFDGTAGAAPPPPAIDEAKA